MSGPRYPVLGFNLQHGRDILTEKWISPRINSSAGHLFNLWNQHVMTRETIDEIDILVPDCLAVTCLLLSNALRI